jgi:hypothetical protein
MDPEFFTKSSKLTIKNDTIWEKRLVSPEKNYWFHSFILLLVFIAFSVDKAIYDTPFDWLYVLLGLIWIAPHLKHIFEFLFQKIWRWYIPLSEVRTIVLDPHYNELEQKVTITVKSGRKKVYVFRTSEHQAEAFTELVSSSISGNSLQTTT